MHLVKSGLAMAILFIAAPAATLTFNINYLETFNRTCSVAFGCTGGAVNNPFLGTFTLESAQLQTDGNYDVSPSINVPRFEIPTQFPQFQIQSYSATAIVLGSVVTDVTLVETSGGLISVSTTQSGGSYSRFLGFFKGSGEQRGTYTISQVQVPEPGTFALVAGSLLVLRRLRKYKV